ncbi:MAG: tetratricopeptide repeat protein [Pirellulales bacterium]
MSRKQLNLKLVAGLAIGGVVLAGGVHLLHGRQLSRNADSLKLRADEAHESGDMGEAVRLRSRFVIFRPKERDQWVKLQQEISDHFTKEVKNQNITPELIARTLKFMERVTQRWPDDAEFRLKAADFYFDIGMSADALDHYRYAFARLAEEGKPLGADETVKLAACVLAAGEQPREDRTGVKEWLESKDSAAGSSANSDRLSPEAMLIQLVGLNPETGEFDAKRATSPKTVDAYDLLGQIYRRRRTPNPELADKVIEQMVAVNPDTANAYVIRAKYRQTFSDGKPPLDLIQADIDKAQSLDSDSDAILLQQVEMALLQRDEAKAEELLKGGIEKFPDNPQFYAIAARIEMGRNELDAAEKYLNEGTRRLQKNLMLQMERANLYLMRKDFKQFGTQFKLLQNMGMVKELSDLLTAKEKYLTGDPRGAMAILEEIRPRLDGSAASEAYRYLDYCYRDQGMVDKRRELWKLQPSNSLAARINEAETLLAVGKFTEAAADLELLTRNLESNRDADPEVLSRVRRMWLTTEIKIQNGRDLDKRNWDKVNELLETVAADPSLPPAHRDAVRLQVLLDQGKESEATELAKKSKQQYPSEAAFWVAQLRLAKSSGEKSALLDEMKEAMGETLNYRLLRADFLAESGGSVEDLGKLVEKMDGLTPQEQDRLVKRVGQALFQRGAMNEARDLWERQAELRPKDSSLQLILFDLAKIAEDEALMQKRLDALGRITGPSSDEYRIARATFLAWKIKFSSDPQQYLKEARELVAGIKSQREEWPTVYQLEAELNLIDGNVDKAIDSLKRAFELEPGNAMVVRRLSTLLTQARRFEEAGRLMRSVSVNMRDTIGDLEQVKILEATGDLQGALQVASRFAESTDVRELELLGRLLIKGNLFADAQTVLRRAAALAPELPESWVLLVDVGVKKSDPLLVESVMQEAQLRLPAWQLPEFLGESYQLLGEFEQANAAYQMALIANPLDSSVLLRSASLALEQKDKPKATELLDKVVTNADSDPEDIVKARRELAKLWSQLDSGVDFDRVIKLFEQQAAQPSSEFGPNTGPPKSGVIDDLSSEDLLLFVNLCANRPEYAYREMAVSTLEKRRSRGRLSDNERLLLATLYHKLNRWENCKELMIELLAGQTARQNQQIIGTWVEWLIEREQDRDLKSWLNVIPADTGASIRAQSYIAVRDGRSRDAMDLFKKLLKASGSDAERAGRTSMAVRWMESLGKYDPAFYIGAENTLRSLKDSATTWADLVRVLARQKSPEKLAKAIDICEKESAKNPEVALEAAVGAIRYHRGRLKDVDESVDRVAKMLSSAPNSPEAILQRAYFAELLGKTDLQEKFYREYLKQPSVTHLVSAIAKNNLAFLLACQGKAEEASKMIDEASQMFGQSPELLDTQAIVKVSQKDYKGAITDLTTALEKGGETPEKLFHMARAKALNGETEEARDYLQRAFKANLEPAELNPFEQKQLQDLQQELKVDGPAKGEQKRA